MSNTITMPASILLSLHKSIDKYKGSFASAKQRKFLVDQLGKFSSHTVLAADEQSRSYVIDDSDGKRWGFTCHRRRGSCLTREPISFGIQLTADIKAQLKTLIQWGPSRESFTAFTHLETAEALIQIAGLNQIEVCVTYLRKTGTAWGADALAAITRIQIAAKGLLAEVGDNAGTTATSMSREDAEYISQMITNAHLRNAHRFTMKATGFTGIRGACIVNKAKMDEATQALAQRMVDLINAQVKLIGRPVSFGEYKVLATA